MIRKKQRKMFEQPRMRSQSQDLYETLDFEEEMKCHETLQQLSYFASNLELNDQLLQDNCTCKCSKCQGFITSMDSNDLDAQLKKRLKRREYKKRQKLKAQQKKEQALKDLSGIIGEIYQLKTDYEKEGEKIEQCLKAIQKNVNRFYQFINAVIRQQVETIKKEMRICLSQLATDQPNFAKVPRLYEQFMKVKDASPEVEKIINTFIDIISEKSHQPTKYQKDLDKKTFRFLLISDAQNRNAFLQVIKLIEEGNIKYEREKQMLRMIIQLVKEKNISSECSSSEEGSDNDYSEEDYYEESEGLNENTTKASEREEEYGDGFEDEGYDENEKENTEVQKNRAKRRRKNKNLKMYEPSFERTYETLLQLQKTLANKKDERLPCRIEEQWLQKFRSKHLKKLAEKK